MTFNLYERLRDGRAPEERKRSMRSVRKLYYLLELKEKTRVGGSACSFSSPRGGRHIGDDRGEKYIRGRGE